MARTLQRSAISNNSAIGDATIRNGHDPSTAEHYGTPGAVVADRSGMERNARAGREDVGDVDLGGHEVEGLRDDRVFVVVNDSSGRHRRLVNEPTPYQRFDIRISWLRCSVPRRGHRWANRVRFSTFQLAPPCGIVLDGNTTRQHGTI